MSLAVDLATVTPPAILTGYAYDSRMHAYRDIQTGRTVARARIVELLDQQIGQRGRRLQDLALAYGRNALTPGQWVTAMRDELRRAHLQQRALGAGGWDRLTPHDYGVIGRALKDDYARVVAFAEQIRLGEVSEAQALNRLNMYMGGARLEYWQALAERLQPSKPGMVILERRRLGIAEHCADCLVYARAGWVPAGLLPRPGERSVCGNNCRCTIESKEVPVGEVEPRRGLVEFGGPGSGNRGHKGRPGLVGGSAPGVQLNNVGGLQKLDKQQQAFLQTELAALPRGLDITVGHPYFNTPLYADAEALTQQRQIFLNPRVYGKRTDESYSLPFPLAHEVGHFQHAATDEFIWNRDWQNETLRAIAAKVSKYASEDPFEFVAETYAGLVNGRKYSTDVLELWRTYSRQPEIARSLSASEAEFGGPGSGNYGHRGRPGMVGGAAPSAGSGIGTGEGALDEQIADAWIAMRDNPAYGSYNGDGYYRELCRLNGYDDTPTVADKATVDQLVADGGTELFRGFSEAEYATQMKEGEHYGSNGIFGAGIYFGHGSEGRQKAELYNIGGLVRAVMPPDARIGRYADLQRLMDAEEDARTSGLFARARALRQRDDPAAESEYERLKGVRKLYDDVGRWATMNGWDGYIANDNEFVVLNRSRLVVER